MHRSGTSLVTKVLEKSGIFMGVVKDHNYEAMHFLSLNQQTLWAAGSSWLEPVVPGPVHYKTIPAKEIYREHFRLNTCQQKLVNRLKNPSWGWKDPRNTFTLPMWLELFPKARVLHIYRKGEEVAQSLKSRNNIKGEVHDKRLDYLDFNLQLWKKYVDQARSYAPGLQNRYLEVDYADIIALNPSAIAKLEHFCQRKLAKLFTQYIR